MEQKPERKYLKLKVDNNRTFEVTDFNLQEFLAVVEKRQPLETMSGGKGNLMDPVRIRLYPLPDNSYLLDSMRKKLGNYKRAMEKEKKDATCETKKRSKFAHQEVLSAYFNVYNPFHGILIYHGMGSGKTCSSVAMAENLLGNQKRIWVLTPKALEANYRAEMLKCSEIYKESQHWEQHKGEWRVTEGDVNFDVLGPKEQQGVRAHLKALIEKHDAYRFVSFSGVNCQNLRAQFSGNTESNPFDASVVVVDEVHLLVELIAKHIKDASSPYSLLYEWLMDAEACRVIALSGTPRANKLSDLGIMFNLLHGYIKVWTLATGKLVEDTQLKRFIHQQHSDGKRLEITRTPNGFEAVYDETGAFLKLNKVDDCWDTHKFQTELSKHGPIQNIDKHKLLPDMEGPFISKEKFQERIEGLTSFFPDLSKLLPKLNATRVHDVPLSDLQSKEHNVHVLHFPNKMPRIVVKTPDVCIGESAENDKYLEDVRKTIVQLKEKEMFRSDNLAKYGPKLAKVAENVVKATTRQLVYSAALENIFFLAEVLEDRGFSKVLLTPPNAPEQKSWSAVAAKDPNKAFIIYTGSVAEMEVLVEFFNKGGARLILASTAMVEGVSLADVSDVHLMEPCTEMSRFSQIVARARRMCKNHTVTEVTPHVYISGKHEKLVFETALSRQKEIDIWLEMLQETAVDCALHRTKCFSSKKRSKEFKLNASTRTLFLGVEQDGLTPLYNREADVEPVVYEKNGEYYDKSRQKVKSIEMLLTPTVGKRKHIKLEVKGYKQSFYVDTNHGVMQPMYKNDTDDAIYGFISFGPPHTLYSTDKEKVQKDFYTDLFV